MVTAVILKRFFRERYGITVRADCKQPERGGWAGVYVPHKRFFKPNGREDHMAPLTYEQTFPEELGRTCLGIVYENGLNGQAWGGNIKPHMISMYQREWDELFRLLNYNQEPTNAEGTSTS